MRTWTLLWIAAAGAVLGLSGRAAAQECESDDDCVKGYACEVVGASGCGFACSSEDPNCEPPPDFMCEEQEYKACVPGECSSDDDCAEGMVCFEFEAYDCPAVADFDCAPGEECVKPEPVECEPSTSSQCVPQYQVPCEEDADCGENFNCVEDVTYTCEGSAPSQPGDSGGGDSGGGGEEPGAGDPRPAPEPIDPPSCTEQPAGTFHCEAREVACESDSDCPSDWTCGENYSRPVCGGASIDPAVPPQPACSDAIPEICRVCEGGGCGEPVCVEGSWQFVCPEDEDTAEPAPLPPEEVPTDDCGIDSDVPERICQPPFADLGWGFAADGVATAAGGMAPVPGSDPGASPNGPAEERADVDENQAASGVGDGDDKSSFGDGENASEPEADSSGCAVSAPGAGRSATSLLPLLGLALLAARRRRG